MPLRTNRRQFLQAGTTIGVGYWVSSWARAEEARSPNERIAMASVGIGGKGTSDSDDAGAHGDMVAICDVDAQRLQEGGQKRFPKAKRFTDFRQMFDEMARVEAPYLPEFLRA